MPAEAETAHQADAAPVGQPAEGEVNDENPVQSVEQETAQDQAPNPMVSNGMGFGMGPGAFPSMAWNNNGAFNPMSQQFMGGGMFNFPNPMG